MGNVYLNQSIKNIARCFLNQNALSIYHFLSN